MSVAVEAAEVCIVGAGLVGCAAALALARLNRRVILLERGKVNSCASGVNFGGVRRHGRLAAELPLAVRSHAIWTRMREGVGADCEFTVTGHLRLARTQADMAELENWAALGREHGVGVELLSPVALAARYRWLAQDLSGASFCPGDGHANPRLAGLAFARVAVHAGVVLHENAEVVSVNDTPSGRFRLDLASSRKIEAEILVNAAGAWGNSIAESYGDNVPLAQVAPQMFVTEPIPHTVHPVIGIVGGAFYLRQTERGNVILGGGRGVVTSDRLRSQPLEETFRSTLDVVCQRIPHLAKVPIIRSWTGVEANMPDGLPVVGASSRRRGLFHAFGFSGHGFQLAPAVGETIAELIVRGRTEFDITPFGPGRFASCPRAEKPVAI